MTNLTRYKQKIFAENSNQIGVFGTGVNKVASTNVETLQSAKYSNGWSAAIVTNKNYPIWQERDGVDYGFSYQLAYLLQKGIPDWLATETYYTNDYCKYGSDIYYSLQDNNIGQNPAGTTGYWKLFASGANTDLSNLTSTGKTKVVDLANELDFANAITVSTTSSTSNQTYTPTADGMLFVVAYMESGSSTKLCSVYIVKNELLSTNHMYGNTVGGTGTAYMASINWYAKSGEQITYYMYTYGSATYVECQATFVPFKKS